MRRPLRSLHAQLFLWAVMPVTFAIIALAMVNYDFGDVGDSLGMVYGQGEVLWNFLLGLALSWLGLAVMVLYGILLSTVIRRPGAAVAAGIGTIYLLDFTKHISIWNRTLRPSTLDTRG